MSLPTTIIFATSNPHKVEEVAAIFAPSGIRVRGLDVIGRPIAEPVEDGRTFLDNAVLKARYYAREVGQLVLADDSGLVVDALGGEPGVHSARYAGIGGPRTVVDPANNAKLLREMDDVADAKRTARFVCVMALCESGRTIATSRGEVPGRIIREGRGANGFGYDPLFLIDEAGSTTAELPAEKKNAISHRGRACRVMIESIRRIYGQ